VISVHDGVMDQFIHTENGVHMVSAPTPKLPKMLYGRFAVRFKADPIPGYKTAWLLWPDSEVWPRDGEIDFPEGDLTSTIGAFMHRQNGTSGGDQDAFSSSFRYTSWHTAVIEWTANRVNFILDGVTIGSSTSRIPNTPMHWVLQTETQIGGGAPASTAQGRVLIDWVAVYVPK
jgi:beta-glucanase (GH16 family)